MKIDNRRVGAGAENIAESWLEGQGYQIIKRNYYTRYGEIDIIAKDGGDIVFIEVKFRKTNKFGTPASAVNYTKRRRIIQTARCFLIENEIDNTGVRFDVVEVYGNYQVNLLKGAFVEE